jgi:hypothetical protein
MRRRYERTVSGGWVEVLIPETPEDMEAIEDRARRGEVDMSASFGDRRQEVEGTAATYETDFYTWTQEQTLALRNKDWAALDVDHLAEEIEDLGQSIEHAIESHLERLLLHLLKYRYDPAQRPRRGWRLTIRHARREISKYLQRNPGLQHHPARYLADAYQVAREDAPDATGLPPDTFPAICPWAIAQVLDLDFWPEEASRC